MIVIAILGILGLGVVALFGSLAVDATQTKDAMNNRLTLTQEIYNEATQ